METRVFNFDLKMFISLIDLIHVPMSRCHNRKSLVRLSIKWLVPLNYSSISRSSYSVVVIIILNLYSTISVAVSQ